ncbi:hypothetical protein BJ508DRAFT_85124 [Ascobolus immersus RN42]|uniref:Uncharacterized protein n=1 Tax=Ascobolus immersus RN42 TaxID=1160509 RepID=A0A3N4HG20_ASCIM|nr:hypothetical protein BJ508DRAFT_85124 [Ascobolus immersus RN42]
MATEVSSYKNECYTVAWICALHIEQRAARLMLDNEHGRPQYVHEADQNAYVLGECHGHLVVIVVLPSGSMGTTPAATTATSLRFSFTNIKYSLMVGIGGGIPGPQTQNPVPDIRLGDVVIGHPEGTSCGVVQYDRGKSVGERFERVGSLNPPPVELMSAVATAPFEKYQRKGPKTVSSPREYER